MAHFYMIYVHMYNVFKVYACSMHWYFATFYCWIIFYCNNTHFIFLFIMLHMLFIHQLMNIFGLFSILIFMDNAAMKVNVQILHGVCFYISWICTWEWSWSYSNSTFNILRNSNFFPVYLYHLHSHQQCKKSLISSYPWFYLLSSLFYYTHSSMCEVVFDCGLDFHISNEYFFWTFLCANQSFVYLLWKNYQQILYI